MGALFSLLVVVGAILFQAFLLRLCAWQVAAEDVAWGPAVGIVLVGGVTQAIVGCVAGDVGGAVLAFVAATLVYGVVISTLTRIELFRAVLVAVAMAVVSTAVWLTIAVLVLGLALLSSPPSG